MKTKYLILLIIGICILIRLTLSISAVPRIEPYVNDFADLLTPEQEMSLNYLSDSIEQNTTYEIALVTVLNTEYQDRLEYANKIGDENGVGKLGQDNGIVVLYSLENEYGGAIATGRGSESIFNDAKVGRIGREAKPFCDEEKYYECFEFIIRELNKEITGKDINNSKVTSSEDIPLKLFGIGLIFFIIMIFIIVGIISSSDSDDSSYSSGTYAGSSSSSSGSSFGGGSFGGGGFGGGGASW